MPMHSFMYPSPMYYPGDIGWYPPINYTYRMKVKKPKTPEQLRKIQARTQRFKSGQVPSGSKSTLRKIEPIPDHVKVQSDENPTSVFPTTSNEAALSYHAKMKDTSQSQFQELLKEAEANGWAFPKIVVDRGVLESEVSSPDVPSIASLPFDPRSVIITVPRGRNCIRSSIIRVCEPLFGLKEDKQYVPVSSPPALGIPSSQLKRIVRDFNNSLLFDASEPEALAKKTA